MTIFLLGFVVGALITGIVAYVVAKQHEARSRREQALLHGRLRSLLALVEIGSLRSENREATSLLDDTRAMVRDQDGVPVGRQTRTNGSTEQGSISGTRYPAEEDVRPIFHR